MSPSASLAGYAHPAYAAAFSQFGTPRALPESGGFILEREIAGSPARDAMGCYPLFACSDWSRLHLDLDALADSGLVSLGLVADPFGDHEVDELARCFPDRLIRFKEHFTVDFAIPASVSKHHRYYARKATAALEVDLCPDPAEFLDDWLALYATLAERHGLTGLKAFSRESFAAQLAVPGMTVLRARAEGETVGAHLWYMAGEVAYSHLAAVSARGYELMAAYALYAFALDHFARRVRWLDIGAGAGAQKDGEDGLTRFKRGWSNGSRPVWFCGRIFDRQAYARAMAAQRVVETQYFPAYRAGELG